MSAQIEILPDAAALTDAAAALIADMATKAIAARGMFSIALSGGNTPRPVYQRLAAPDIAARIDWSRVQVCFGDERCVPPEDPRSNFAMAQDALLAHVPLPPGNIHRIRGEEDPAQAAAAYAAELRSLLGPSLCFDLALQGMGDNGHTASLFPGLSWVAQPDPEVLAQYVEVAGMWRVTLTPRVLNAARCVVFLVAGAEKAAMLQRVIQGPRMPIVLPSQSIQPSSGDLRWLLDRAAAAQLTPTA